MLKVTRVFTSQNDVFSVLVNNVWCNGKKKLGMEMNGFVKNDYL